MDPAPPTEPRNPGSHCYVTTSDGQRHRFGILVRWGQQPVPGRKPGVTEHHADVHYINLDDTGRAWVVKH